MTHDTGRGDSSLFKAVTCTQAISTFTIAATMGAFAVIGQAHFYRSAVEVCALAETDPVRNGGDAADDVAIWIDPTDRERSLIFGTDKKGGLGVYDLSGRLLQFLPTGLLNNVDLRCGFPFQDGPAPIIAASEKAKDAIAIFRLDSSTRALTQLALLPAEDQFDVGGLCLYQSAQSRALYAFVASKDGRVDQWMIMPDGPTITSRIVRRLRFGTKVEGCVADDDLGALYVAEEGVGVWRLGAEPDDEEHRTLIDRTDWRGRLRSDVEGLALISKEDGEGYLVVSNQGNNDFMVYRRDRGNDCIGRFRVVASNSVDGVSQTDGIEAVSADLGASYPHGLFVCQDHDNRGRNQNFKLVSWQTIADELGIDP